MAESIGVIAPYRAQVALLKNEMSIVNPDIEVNTVDQYQGRAKEVIIYSCTKNSVAKVINSVIVYYFSILLTVVCILRMLAY